MASTPRIVIIGAGIVGTNLADELVGLFARDKKAVGGVTFVLDGPRGVEPVKDVPRSTIDAALAACR